MNVYLAISLLQWKTNPTLQVEISFKDVLEAVWHHSLFYRNSIPLRSLIWLLAYYEWFPFFTSFAKGIFFGKKLVYQAQLSVYLWQSDTSRFWSLVAKLFEFSKIQEFPDFL